MCFDTRRTHKRGGTTSAPRLLNPLAVTGLSAHPLLLLPQGPGQDSHSRLTGTVARSICVCITHDPPPAPSSLTRRCHGLGTDTARAGSNTPAKKNDTATFISTLSVEGCACLCASSQRIARMRKRSIDRENVDGSVETWEPPSFKIVWGAGANAAMRIWIWCSAGQDASPRP